MLVGAGSPSQGRRVPIIEGIGLVNCNRLSQPAHGHGKSLHEPGLACQHWPSRLPVLDEADLVLPLDVPVVIDIAGRVKTQTSVQEANLHGFATEPKDDLLVSISRIE